MITHIEIDGFKSFHNFSVDLKPFQVLIGPNGVGKSNLFDAIVLLSNLAGDNTLYDAFRKNRGEVVELFTLYPDGNRAAEIHFAVEMLIGRTVVDSSGADGKVSSTRLRYELGIERRPENSFERLYVTYERLNAIIEDNDRWFKIVPQKARTKWIERSRRAPYISTENQAIYKHQDGRSGIRKQETPLGRVERTVLSTIGSIEFPTAYAVRQEMINWQFLQLNPIALRAPSGIYTPDELSADGSNLAAVMYRLSHENEFALIDISRDMANIVPGILNVSVKLQGFGERAEFLIEAETQDHSIFSSRTLSDGTLRLLSLVTLKNDPKHRGVICLEEPENGVHPKRLPQIIKVLEELATNFESYDGVEVIVPKQLLVNTHSPRLASYAKPEDLLFVHMPVSRPRSTRLAPVIVQAPLFPEENKPERFYTLRQVQEYLDPSSLHERIQELEELEESI